jgi:hypothetical protein
MEPLAPAALRAAPLAALTALLPRRPGSRPARATARPPVDTRARLARGSEPRTAMGQSRERRASFARTTARVSGYPAAHCARRWRRTGGGFPGLGAMEPLAPAALRAAPLAALTALFRRRPGSRPARATARPPVDGRPRPARGSEPRTAMGQSRERRPSFARTTARVSGYPAAHCARRWRRTGGGFPGLGRDGTARSRSASRCFARGSDCVATPPPRISTRACNRPATG